MRLWRALLGQGRQEIARYSWDQYQNDIAVAFQGQRYLLSGGTTGWTKTEDLEHSFTSYISGLYKSNGIVFAIVLARMLLFTEARFCWFEIQENGEDGRPKGRDGLEVLEKPWPNCGTGELLARMEQDVSLGGNFYAVREGDRLRRLRPDWVTIVLTAPPAESTYSDVAGYWYHPGRSYSNAGEPGPGDEVYLPDECMHWSPMPDPDAQYRGMSWLSPVVREVMADKAARDHKLAFFENGATFGAIISAKESLTNQQYKEWRQNFEGIHSGAGNAYKSLFLASPVDTSVLSANMQQLDFKVVQGAGETRLCAAGGVPPIIVGLSEGLASATYSNYGMARRKFGDHWAHPQWKSASQALSSLVDAPGEDLRLGVNTKGIAFLREDAKDLATIQQIKASTLSTLIMGGFTPESSVAAVEAEDLSLLEHSGLTSVQLVPPGTTEPTGELGELFAEDEFAEDELLGEEGELGEEAERARYNIRNPEGSVGGGRFRKLSDAIVALLKDGDDKVLDDFNDRQLRKAADQLGLVTPRARYSRAQLESVLKQHVGRKAPARPAKKAAPRAPAKKAAPRRAERPTRGDFLSVAESDRKSLREAVESGERSSRKASVASGDGHMSETRIVTFRDGTKAIRKTFTFSGVDGTEKERQRDAEELASLVARAVGLDAAPAVYRDSDGSVLMELLDGERGARVERDKDRLARLIDSPDGLRLGLLDILTGNSDRGADWFLTEDGRIAPYDNGFGWFANQRLGREGEVLPHRGLRPDYNPFVGPFLEWVNFDNRWRDNPLFSEDFRSIRENLTRLRPEFERLGHVDWYEDSLARLDTLAARAGGDGPRLRPDGVEQARQRQADIDSARKYADVASVLDELSANEATDEALAHRLRTAARDIESDVAPVLEAVEQRRQIEVENRIRSAYRARPKAPGGWVGLADLRADLADLDREEVDDALRRIARTPGVRVAPFDNQRALDQAGRDAAIHIGDSDRHMVSFGRDSSDRPMPDASAAMADLLREHGISQDGNAGTSTRYDPAIHSPIDGSIRPGASVEVVRPGFTLDRDGEKVRLSKAVVEEVDEAPSVSGGSLPSGADIEVVGSTRDLTPTELMQGRHLTPAGRRALDALGPTGHPRIAAIPDTEGKIREAYRMLSVPGGGSDSYVALEDLRKLVGEQVSRADVDDTLRRMNQMPGVFLVEQSYARGNAATRIPAALHLGGRELNQIRIDDPTLSRPSQFAAVEMAEELQARQTGGTEHPLMALLSDADLRTEIDARASRDPVVARDLKNMGYDATPPAPDPLSSLRTLDPEATRDALDLRKVDELKAMIREVNARDGVKLPVSGRKRDLVDRLVGHLHPGDSPTAPAPRKRTPKKAAPAASPAAANAPSLREIADSPLTEEPRFLGGGLSGAAVTLEHHAKGTVVRKKFSDSEYPGHARKQADAEHLGALVARSVGVETPTVERLDDDSVQMEYVSAATNGAEMPRSDFGRIVESPQGRLLGLFDVLVANSDRNPGNIMQREDGSVVALDHAYAFGLWTAGVGSPFAGHLISESGNDWADDIGIDRDAMAAIGARLRELESEFRNAGRGDWFDQMMERYDILATRAR